MSTSNAPAAAPTADRHMPFHGPRVRALRMAAGLTAPQLLARIRAQPFDLSLSGLTSIERGRTRPRPDTAKAIALALGLDLAQFKPHIPEVSPCPRRPPNP